MTFLTNLNNFIETFNLFLEIFFFLINKTQEIETKTVFFISIQVMYYMIIRFLLSMFTTHDKR